MQLWMIRHAEAMSVWETGGSDYDRPLTDDGRAEFGRLCRGLQTDARPELILHSPRRRAVETAEILRESLDLAAGTMTMIPALSESTLLTDLVSATAHRTEPVIAIVGHQPCMGHLVHTMTGANVRFSPGTIVVVEFAAGNAAKDMGELVWSESP